jgi:Zn-dependent M28 family amino/carboxypeptidase
VLEVARLLAGSGEEEGDDDGPNYDNTLVFVSFSGEEQGLIGSGSFAAKLTTQVFPGASVIAMLNNDITGGDNTVNGPAQLRQFRLYSPGTPRERSSGAADGTTDNTSPARGLMRYVGTWGAAYVPGMQMVPKLREDRPGRGSDQSSFIRLGIPAVRFMETVECSPSHPDNSTPYPPPGYPANCLDFTTAHQHAPTDLAAFTTPSYTARIAQVMASVMASLGRAPGAPQNIQVTGDSVHGATVSWSAPAFGRVHEYVIAGRSTSVNLYGQQVRVGKRETSRFVTASDLGVPDGASFFVSVAAVDERNHESLFAYPEYRCSPFDPLHPDTSGCVVPAGAGNITASK